MYGTLHCLNFVLTGVEIGWKEECEEAFYRKDRTNSPIEILREIELKRSGFALREHIILVKGPLLKENEACSHREAH